MGTPSRSCPQCQKLLPDDAVFCQQCGVATRNTVLYSLTFVVSPTPGSPAYGGYRNREVEMVVNESTEETAESKAREWLEDRDWTVESVHGAHPIDVAASAPGTAARKVVSRALVQGVAMILGPEFPPR